MAEEDKKRYSAEIAACVPTARACWALALARNSTDATRALQLREDQEVKYFCCCRDAPVSPLLAGSSAFDEKNRIPHTVLDTCHTHTLCLRRLHPPPHRPRLQGKAARSEQRLLLPVR